MADQPEPNTADILARQQKDIGDLMLRIGALHHENRSLLNEFEFCKISYGRDMHPIHGNNLTHLLGPMYVNEHIPDYFAAESKPYFQALWDLVDVVNTAPERPGAQAWHSTTVREDPRLDLRTWIQVGQNDWQVEADRALAQPLKPELREFCLGSPVPLIPPKADMRIEYTAWNDQDPCELSVIVGVPMIVRQESRKLLQDPSENSYCFAFGAFNNHQSVLQRCLRPIGSNEAVKIERGKRHQVVAERIGGVLRLLVDGREAFREVDISPLEDPHGSWVTLYSSTPGAHFTDLKVHTRDSCLTAEEWKRIGAYRRQTLKFDYRGRLRYLDSRVNHVSYRAKHPEIWLFLKDVTATVTEHLEKEKHKKEEEALREANAVLEEKIADRTRELAQALERLRHSEQRYALAGLGSNDGLWDWNLDSNEVYFSPRWKQMLGYSDAEVPNTLKAWYDLVHPEDLSPLRQALENHFAGGTEKFAHEYRMQHKNGEVRWVLTRGAAIRDGNGAPLRIAGSQTDITLRKQNELALARDAMHDSLTGLPNRAHFRLKVAEAIHKRDTEETPFALLFLDLDGFKPVNDKFGHEVGDQLLVAIARRLEKLLRPHDVLARLGGDEFTVLLNKSGGQVVIDRVAERMISSFEAPFQLGGETISLGVSIGVAVGRKQFKTPDEIIRKADSAMYHVKMAKKK